MSNVNGQLSIVFKILIFLLGFLILTRFNIDPDLGWHLAYGQRFLKMGEIIRADSFSWTMPGYVWGNSYFIYQILLTLLWERFGHILVGIFFGVIATLAVVIVSFRFPLSLWKVLIIGASAVLASANLGVRPHTISFLFFAILLVLLDAGFWKKWWQVIFWFIFFAVWANLHRGFLVGLMTFVAYLMLDYFWQRAKSKRVFLKSRILGILAAILGTFLTPFPMGIWQSGFFLDLSSKSNLSAIAEWQSIALYFPLSLIQALTGLIFIYVFFRKMKVVEPVWFLIASGLFMFAFLFSTLAFFWVAIFIFIIMRNLAVADLQWDFWARLPFAIVTVAVLAAFFLSFLIEVLKSYDLKIRLTFDKYPVGALEFLKQNGGWHLFNEYAWGGYIDWQAPEVKVFIDGRMASWRSADKNILVDYLAIRKGDCRPLGRYEIEAILVSKSFDTSCFDGWQVAYEDTVAKILTKP